MRLDIWFLNQINIFVTLWLPNQFWNRLIVHVFSLIQLSQPLFLIVEFLEIELIIKFELLSELFVLIINFFLHSASKPSCLFSILPSSCPFLHNYSCSGVSFAFLIFLPGCFVLDVDDAWYFRGHIKVLNWLVDNLSFFFFDGLIVIWFIALLRWSFFLREIQHIFLKILGLWWLPAFFSSLILDNLIKAIVTTEAISVFPGAYLSLILQRKHTIPRQLMPY